MTRALLAVLLGLSLATVVPASTHPARDAEAPTDDGHVSLHYSGDGERAWTLRTLDERREVRVQLVAHTGSSSIHVRILDPDGRQVADMSGSGELDVDSGTIRLVDHPAASDEARRGSWRVEVSHRHGEGSFELRWWGLAPPATSGGSAQ